MNNQVLEHESFFRALYGHCTRGSINLRFLPPGENIFVPIQKIDTITEILKGRQQQNAYFGVALRTEGNGTKEGITEIPAVWCDIDYKTTSEKDVTGKLTQFPLRPSAQVLSGGGCHPYWFLREASGNGDVAEVEKINRRLAVYFGGDVAATDASRILRVPGTPNLKYNPPRYAKIIELDGSRQYNLSDFDELLPELPQGGGVNPPNWQDGLLPGVSQGMRTYSAEKLAGRYIGKGLTPQEVLDLLRSWNGRNKPPLTDEELKTIVAGVKRTDERNHPQPAEKKDPLEFPDYLMSGVAKDFAELYSKYMEPPKVFLFFGFLTALGSMLAGRLYIKSEIRPTTRLYILCLGQSGEPRKSTGITMPVEFFHKFFPGSVNASYGVGSAEGLQAKIKSNPDSRLLLVFDEFKAFISKCKIESSILLPCVNTLFEATRYESRTKSVDISLTDTHLSIVAASTLQTYQNTWTHQFLDIGFTNRLFLVPGRATRAHPVPEEIPDRDKLALANKIKDRLKILDGHDAGGFGMTLTTEGKKAFDEWYFKREVSVHTIRLDTYALRLMPLIAISEGKVEVDLDVVQRVIVMMGWQQAVREQLDPIDADNVIAQLEERIRRALKRGPMVDRTLRQAVNANRAGLWFYRTALNNLGQSSEIKFNGKGKTWELSLEV